MKQFLQSAFVIGAFCLSVLNTLAQQILIPLEQERSSRTEKFLLQNPSFHSAIRPFWIGQGNKNFEFQSGLKKGRNLWYSVQPIINAKGVFDSDSNAFFLNTITGAEINLASSQWAVHASWAAGITNQSAGAWSDSLGIIPHWGKSQSMGSDFTWYPAFDIRLRFSPVHYASFETGYGKHFWGDGYCSLLLSDNSSPFPYAMLEAHIWKLKYVQLYSWLKDIDYPRSWDWKNKYASTHILSLNLFKKLNVYVFESVVWQQVDSVSYTNFDINYLNPLIFFRPVEFQEGDPSSDNVLIGGGFRFQLSPSLHIYSQVMIDEFNLKEIKDSNGWWGNKQALQLGFKCFSFAGNKNWFVQGEFNYVRPYTYSHENSMKNYGHMGQPLAHPAGANFREVLVISRFDAEKYSLQLKITGFETGLDTNQSSLGQDIYKSYTLREHEYNNKILQGKLFRQVNTEIKISVPVKKEWNLQFEIGGKIDYRMEPERKIIPQVFAGFRTLLFNE